MVLQYINLLCKCLFCNHIIDCNSTSVLCPHCIATHFKIKTRVTSSCLFSLLICRLGLCMSNLDLSDMKCNFLIFAQMSNRVKSPILIILVHIKSLLCQNCVFEYQGRPFLSSLKNFPIWCRNYSHDCLLDVEQLGKCGWGSLIWESCFGFHGKYEIHLKWMTHIYQFNVITVKT